MKNKILMRIVITCALFCAPGAGFAQLELGQDLISLAGEDTISLDLKGMDIIEVLKTLATKGKMNIVVGANVRGRVTMFLKDVDVGEAFEIILAANNLASDRRGDIIYVMTERDYEQLYGRKYEDKTKAKIIQLKYAKASEINKALSQIKTKVGKVIVDEGSNTLVVIDAPEALERALDLVKKLDKPTSTRIFELNYAATADIEGKIEEILTKGVGSVQIDERTNKILITDLKDRMDEIEKILVAFDAKSQQVLIDAKIIEITLTDEFKLGVDWQSVIEEVQDRVGSPLTVRSQFNITSDSAFPPGIEFTVGDVDADTYTTLVQALKEIGDVNTLSNPRIMVMNNEEAKILIGDSEPYAIQSTTQSGDLATTGSELNFLEIGVKLYVTPTINRDNFITMKIKPEISNSTRNYSYGTPEVTVPVVSTTQAETSVMVKDGTTIIIAGLIKDDRSNTDAEVPFLGDIPIIGWAFRRTEKQVQKKELVMFITPYIVSGDSDYMEIPVIPPIGEPRFTIPEEPTFYDRRPVKMTPGFLYSKEKTTSPNTGGGLLHGNNNKIKKKKITPAPRKRPNSPDEYFNIVKEDILRGLSIPDGDPHVKIGDKARVYFRLYSGGNLAAKPKVTETTNEYLGSEIISAVERSAPFPPFPLSIREFKKDFSLDIVYDPK